MTDNVSSAPTNSEFLARLQVVRDRIESAGGSLEKVKIVAVTKTLDQAKVELALRHGLVDVGENYAQEILAKSADLGAAQAHRSDLAGEQTDVRLPRWNLIGNVQRNKVRKLAPVVSLWQTVDRSSLAIEIAKRAPGATVLIQVNTTGEESKAGIAPDLVAALLEEARDLGLDVQGLMTVGPTDRSVDPRPAFANLRELADDLDLETRSMGMSGDIESAVSEGSTMIRVGTALFGARDRAN